MYIDVTRRLFLRFVCYRSEMSSSSAVAQVVEDRIEFLQAPQIFTISLAHF
jgi:hypothetical protein